MPAASAGQMLCGPKRRTWFRTVLGLLIGVNQACLRQGGSAEVVTAIPDPPLPGIAKGAHLAPVLKEALKAKGKNYVPRTEHIQPDGKPKYTNRLILESSPYLLQHAHNPVNWYAWGKEPFERARREGKLVLLSIGYSTCHWCHVMERESFEDQEIAAFLNQNYVCIKVDREERPDVDSVYMTAVNLLTGRGGWPMTTLLTSEGEVVFGGTYFPPRDGDRGARRGFLSILKEIRRSYLHDPESLRVNAAELSRRIVLAAQAPRPTAVPGEEVLKNAAQIYAQRYDPIWGGFGRAPKFPRPSSLAFLSRFSRRSRDVQFQGMVLRTLEAMAQGGMRDHVGGGFHRYSTDARWLVPHFEKMLYDNAQLVVAYLEGYQMSGREDFSNIARETLDYVAREMLHEEGGFYSATDADSPTAKGHDEEGLFFTWTPEELETVLGAERARVVQVAYGVRPGGNFEGRSILHTPRSLAEVAEELGLALDALGRELQEARDLLYSARLKRAPPLLDRKVIAAWNGLMISAFAKGAWVLGEPRYAEVAARAVRFIEKHMYDGGRLQRTWLDGQGSGAAFLDDYAFLISGLIDLYEATFEPEWLRLAQRFQQSLDVSFADDAGGYFFTGSEHDVLITREKPDYDGAEPSGNSVAVMNLLRLYEFVDHEPYRRQAERALAAFGQTLSRRGMAVPYMLSALDYYLDEPLQIVLVAPEGGDTASLEEVLRRSFVPNKIVIVSRDGAVQAKHTVLLPLLKDRSALKGQATAYVCRRKVCELPTSNPEVFEKQLLPKI